MSDHEELPEEPKNPFGEAESEAQQPVKKKANVISLKPDDLC